MASYDNKVLKGDQLVVYTQKVKEGLASKQNKISADSKLDYSLQLFLLTTINLQMVLDIKPPMTQIPPFQAKDIKQVLRQKPQLLIRAILQ